MKLRILFLQPAKGFIETEVLVRNFIRLGVHFKSDYAHRIEIQEHQEAGLVIAVSRVVFLKFFFIPRDEFRNCKSFRMQSAVIQQSAENLGISF